jgi:hypothetical protein
VYIVFPVLISMDGVFGEARLDSEIAGLDCKVIHSLCKINDMYPN